MTDDKNKRGKKRKRRMIVRIPSTVKGIDPVEWQIEMSGAGIRAKKIGDRNEDACAATWRTLLGVLLVHGSRKAISTRDAKSHLKKKKRGS